MSSRAHLRSFLLTPRSTVLLVGQHSTSSSLSDPVPTLTPVVVAGVKRKSNEAFEQDDKGDDIEGEDDDEESTNSTVEVEPIDKPSSYCRHGQ